MKTYYLLRFFFFAVFSFALWTVQAQYSATGFAFQGYAIDQNSKAIASTGITTRFTIYRTGINYVEEHSLTTDSYGVFVANVGEGTTTSTITFGELDFNNFDFSMKVEVRETAGGVFVTISDKALQAVPYARAASNGVPVGTIVAYAGPDTNIPTGWLLCNGATLNSTTNPQYKQLFAAIGISWGGSGAGSFNIPDLRGMFLRGLNKETTGTDANRTLGSFQAGDIQSHAHPASASTDGLHNHLYNNPKIGSFSLQSNTSDFPTRTKEYTTDNGGATSTNGSHSHTISVGAVGGAETRPSNKAVNYIIKY